MNLFLILLAALHPKAVRKDPMCPFMPGQNSTTQPPFFYKHQYDFNITRDHVIGRIRAYTTWNTKLRYSLVGTDDFAVDVMSGNIKVMTPPNRETPKHHMFFAVATDQNLKSATAIIKIYMANERNNTACPPGVPVASCVADPCMAHVCPAFPNAECRSNYCGGCNAEYYSDGVRVNCTGSACPPGVPVALCAADPCMAHVCPAFPNAECRSNNCGGCNAEYYYNGVRVNCSGSACPPGVPIASCVADPCMAHVCPAFPNAECRSNYCGGCNAEYYYNGVRVNCSGSGCPPGVPVAMCVADPCMAYECPAFPNAVCHSNYCGGCNAEYYYNGSRVNCSGSACPPGVPIAMCETDPCMPDGCPAFPNAVCRSNYCGGCNAEYYYNGVRVNCAGSVCPDGVPIFNCLVDPCSAACPLYPNAQCRSNYCGGCNAEYYYNGVRVNCTGSGCSSPNCLVDPCLNASCPAFPDAKCLADHCGGCNANFYYGTSLLNCTGNAASEGAPIFRRSLYNFTVNLPVPQNMSIGRVEAATKSKVVYSIVDSSPFRVNSSTGNFTMASHADSGVHIIRVQATDSEGRKGFAVVEVTVTQPPATSPIVLPVYSVYVREGDQNGSINLYSLRIVSLPNPGSDVSFSLESTKDSAAFEISSMGIISVTRALDYEIKREYDLTVVVNTATAASISSMKIRLRVLVKNLNDNSPYFVGMQSPFLVSSELNVGEVLYKFSVNDPDGNDMNTVELANIADRSNFEIEPQTNTLKPLNRLTRNTTYSIPIITFDHGVPSRSVSATFLLRTFDPTSGRPLFPFRYLELWIREDASINTLLKRVTATGGGQMKYTEDPLTDGQNVFRVNSSTGDIYTDRLLDRESLGKVSFVMVATSSTNSLSSYVIIFLVIMDVNDNAPIWRFSNYRVDVSRRSRIGMPVFEERAIDADLNPQITYSISGTYANLFRVRPEDNVITLAEDFPENLMDFKIRMTASDGLYSSYTDLTVVIH